MKDLKFRCFYRGKLHLVGEIQFFEDGSYCVSQLLGTSVYPDSEHVKGVTQFTGRTDLNNNDIYEGDYLERRGRRAVVEWDEDECKFLCRIVQVDVNDDSYSVGEVYPLMSMFTRWGVVGNIYESK